MLYCPQRLCFTVHRDYVVLSTEIVRTSEDEEPRTVTSTFTQLLSSERSGGRGRLVYNATLSPPEWFCIKVGNGESHLNVSVIRRGLKEGVSQKLCPYNHNLWREKTAEAESNGGPPLTSPTLYLWFQPVHSCPVFWVIKTFCDITLTLADRPHGLSFDWSRRSTALWKVVRATENC